MLWICLTLLLILVGLLAAAVGVVAFQVLLPWAAGSLAIGIALASGRARTQSLRVSLLASTVSGVVAFQSFLASSPDLRDLPGMIATVSVAIAIASATSLWQGRSP
jgi:hypothetical protein